MVSELTLPQLVEIISISKFEEGKRAQLMSRIDWGKDVEVLTGLLFKCVHEAAVHCVIDFTRPSLQSLILTSWTKTYNSRLLVGYTHAEIRECVEHGVVPKLKECLKDS